MATAARTHLRPVIVVGVDGSPTGDAALRWAVHHAASTGAAVRAVLVLGAPVIAPAGFDGFCAMPEVDLLDGATVLDRAIARSLADPLQCAAIERRVLIGSPLERLLDEATSAAMLVVGQGGRPRARRLLSTARQLVSRASCPVVVVPADAGRHAPAATPVEHHAATARPLPGVLTGASH